ncbi:nucleotide pyrophosphohydrolase [Georgenia daeguensis]|uniref:Nucleotide pyrophosphohydrolase n=1 Tax=Georgenia daeguensis TaxID=908355 RepID=A0ABP8EU54_9MICO
MDISDVLARLRDFTDERDWAQFHTPRNLVLALVGEVGELAELVQWRTDAEVVDLARTDDGREALADELADVFTYLVGISDALGIDLDEAVHAKISKNAVKYPPHLARGSNAKYTELRTADSDGTPDVS